MFVACASCGKRVSDRAPACPFCGTTLAPAQSEVRPALEPSIAAPPAPAGTAPIAGAAPAPAGARLAVASLPAFVRGDFIGDGLQVLQVLGEGGFGVVYLVSSQATGETLALKTVRSELLRDEAARALFLKEARIWIELGQHPYLVRARWLDEINGRPYLAMEYVRGGPGRPNDLEGYLRTRPPDLVRALSWAIQFCHGMEYAYGRGIRCHRDIKPANVLIGEDERVRISDFGIAGLALSPDAVPGGDGGAGTGDGDPARTALGTVFGTPTHMSPEQFEGAAGCDERSDVYSFGVMLFQMASRGRLPFVPAAPPPGVAPGAWYFHTLRQLHRTTPPPGLEGPLGPIVARTLAKRPQDRHAGFAALRAELETVFRQQTGHEPEPPPAVGETAADVSNRGLTLTSLGRHEEALAAYDQALALAPDEPKIHSNRASALRRLGRHAEALEAAGRAIALDAFAAGPWLNKGLVLVELGRLDEAVAAFDHSLALDPRSAEAWTSKGVVLGRLGREAEELGCLERATELDPRNPIAWFNLGNLLSTRRDPRGVSCFDRALALDPRAEAPWGARGVLLCELGRFEESVASLDEAIRLAPAEPRNWYNKGNALVGLGSRETALACFGEATRLAPLFPTGWYNRALAALQLGRAEEALAFFAEYLRLAPAIDPLRAGAERLANELRSGRVPQVVTTPGATRVQDTGMGAPPARVASAGEPPPRPKPVDPGPAPTTTETLAAPAPAAPPPDAPVSSVARPVPSVATASPVLPRPPLPTRPSGTIAEWNDRASAHFEGRRFADALAAAESALALDPRNATGLNNRANALFGLGRVEEAVRAHERLVEIAPAFVPSWCNRAAILSRCGRKPEALRAFLETIELAADDADSPQLAQARQSAAGLQGEGVRPAARTHHGLLAAGYQAMVRGQGAQAIAAFDAAVRAAPQCPACWEWQASALRELGRFDEALACASEGVRAAGEDASLHHERGLALVQLRRFGQAVAAFEDAIRADPLAPAAWSDRGKTLGLLRRLEEARDSLARATELAPQHPAPWQNKALVEEELGLHAEAARSYALFLERATPEMRLQIEQARSRIPVLEAQARARRGEPLRAPAVPVVELPVTRPVAAALPVAGSAPVPISPAPVPEVKERVPFADALRRAQLNLNQGQAERALGFFDQALAADPASMGAWAGKAEALSRLGRHAESIAHADRALALNPRLVEMWQRRGTGYEALRRYAEALASWDEGLAVAPKSLPLLNGRGLALYYLGRLEEAAAAFDAVLALEPRHALARFNRAHVDLKAGRTADAARGLRQFLALAPPQLGAQIADARARLAALESP